MPLAQRRAEVVSRGKAVLSAVKEAQKVGGRPGRERKGKPCFDEMRDQFAKLDAAVKPVARLMGPTVDLGFTVSWFSDVHSLALGEAKQCANCSESGQAACEKAAAEVKRIEPLIK